MKNNSSSAQDESDISARLAKVESAMWEFAPEGGGVDVRSLVVALWKGKWVILAATALSGVISVFVALSLPNKYTATALLMPASVSTGSSLSRLAGQFGGLASLAGVSLGGDDQSNKITAALELIKTWGFQESFVRDNQLEVPVFAAKGWIKESNQLVINPAVYDVQKEIWVGNFNPSPGQVNGPGGFELFKKFSSWVTINQDRKTNLVTLSVEYYSPFLAKEWVDKLVIAVNKHLQDQDRIEAEKSVQYLQEKLAQTSLTELRTMLSRLIEEQTKNLMLAKVSEEYVLQTLSPAKVPEEKSGPKRGSFCIAVTLAGAFLSIVGWLIWLMYRGELNSSAFAKKRGAP